jgi:O-antigen/teichoic acid export membrane protein
VFDKNEKRVLATRDWVLDNSILDFGKLKLPLMQSSKESSNLRQKAVKGVVWSAIQSWGSQVISFAVFSLLARLLSPQDFGLVATAGVVVTFMQIFLEQGFSEAIVQRDELESEHLDTAFWTILGIGTLLTIIGFSSADIVANFFNQPQLTLIVRCLSFNFLFSALNSVQAAILSRQLYFKALAIRSLLATLAGGTVGIVMAFRGFGVWSLVCQQLSFGLVAVITLWRVSDWRPGFRFSKKHFLEMFSFGINIVGFNFLNFFSRHGDDLLIGYFLGAIALGYYNVAYRILLVMTQLLVRILTQVALPTFSRLKQEPEKLRNAFYSATQLSSLISFPIFISVAVLAPEIVRVVFGNKWESSIPVMQALSLVGPLHCIFFFNGSLMIAMGKPSWRLWVTFINSVSNFIAFFLVVKWGILAVAMAYVIRGYLLAPIPLLLLRKLINLDLVIYFRQYLTQVCGCVAIVAIVLTFKYFFAASISANVMLAICIPLAAATYIAVIALLDNQLFKKLSELAKLALYKQKNISKKGV